jgi:macrophage erythroblast attacher
MADYKPVKVNNEAHLLLDQPLLKLPYELSRNNFKTVQRHIEQTQAKIDELLKNGLKASADGDPTKVVAALDQAISRLQTLQKKLETLEQQQASIIRQSGARIDHLGQLRQIETLSDVKYEEWSKTRLDRLLVDYLVRNGYVSTATRLSETKGIKELVDIDTFVSAAKVEKSLRRERSVDLALTWCAENKLNLKKLNVSTLTHVPLHI